MQRLPTEEANVRHHLFLVLMPRLQLLLLLLMLLLLTALLPRHHFTGYHWFGRTEAAVTPLQGSIPLLPQVEKSARCVL